MALNKDKFERAIANIDKVAAKVYRLADDLERYGEAAINAGIEGERKRWTLQAVWESDELRKACAHISEATGKAVRK